MHKLFYFLAVIIKWQYSINGLIIQQYKNEVSCKIKINTVTVKCDKCQIRREAYNDTMYQMTGANGLWLTKCI